MKWTAALHVLLLFAWLGGSAAAADDDSGGEAPDDDDNAVTDPLVNSTGISTTAVCWECPDDPSVCHQSNCSGCKITLEGVGGTADAASVVSSPFQCIRQAATFTSRQDGTCVDSCSNQCPDAPVACGTSCVANCGACMAIDGEWRQLWDCPSRGRCVESCQADCPAQTFPEKSIMSTYNRQFRLLRVISSKDRRIQLFNEYKRRSGLQGSCMDKSAWQWLLVNRCRFACGQMVQMFMLVQGCAFFTLIFSFLIITSWPGMYKSHMYEHLVEPKINEGKTITQVLVKSMVAVSRATYLIQIKSTCLTDAGADWSFSDGLPSSKILQSSGFIVAHVLGGFYIVLQLLLALVKDQDDAGSKSDQCLHDFKSLVIMEGQRSEVCAPKEGCTASDYYGHRPECQFTRREKTECMRAVREKMQDWQWKNLYFRGTRSNILPKSLKKMALYAYVHQLRKYTSNMFMACYVLAVTTTGWAMGHLFFWAIQWNPEASGGRYEVANTSLVLWGISSVFVVATRVMYTWAVNRPDDGFRLRCLSEPGVLSLDCTMWRDCMTCEGLSPEEYEKCNDSNFHRSANEASTTLADSKEWMERTATCWALTRKLALSSDNPLELTKPNRDVVGRAFKARRQGRNTQSGNDEQDMDIDVGFDGAD